MSIIHAQNGQIDDDSFLNSIATTSNNQNNFIDCIKNKEGTHKIIIIIFNLIIEDVCLFVLY